MTCAVLNSELTREHLLQYSNLSVITYFCHKYPQYSSEEAELLFADLLDWMWLNLQRKKLGKNTYLFGPLLVLDDLWHVFILHTQDYLDFSICYFGAYFHHEIEPIGHEHQVSDADLEDFLCDCFIFLDEQWVERRFNAALL